MIQMTNPPRDTPGHFGKFGGRYVSEMLIPALEELEEAYEDARNDPGFQEELNTLYLTFAGRPTPLFLARNLSKRLGGARVYFKNEGANLTGAHKMNHCLGQALLAKRMGKNRLIAETGAGQHGVAVATVARLFDLECKIYMGEVDVERQYPNVFWMQQLKATVVPVKSGNRTLKDAVSAAQRDWSGSFRYTYNLVGSALGPHPYPAIVRDFQSVVGKEVRQQILRAEGRLPHYLVACVGGGSNAIGLFAPFLDDRDVSLVAVEAGGKGIEPRRHAARFQGGKLGVLDGYKSYFLQDDEGQVMPTHSISAGLDYAGVGPQLAYLQATGRIAATYATDDEALAAFRLLAETEGLIPALESAHAVAEAVKLAPRLGREEIVVVNLSGRGDKDLFIVAGALDDDARKEWLNFLKREITRLEVGQ